MDAMEKSWASSLKAEFSKDYYKRLIDFVEKEYKNETIYPEQSNLFRALELCSFDDVKVVILGQDPYHGPGQANGLAFAVNENTKLPPSLRNIFKEISSDLQIKPLENGDLSRWAKQGVLLLNATLSVRKESPGSHQKRGWEEFTDAVIQLLSEKKKGVVFVLWGNYAKAKGVKIDRNKHCVIESAHPSPLSAHNGFWGSKPFSKVNEYLRQRGLEEIDWR